MKKIFIQYLKNIFFWILILNFIVSFFSFITNIESYLTPSKIAKNPTDSSLIDYGKNLEKELEDLTGDLKDTYGEDYPSLGICYYRTILHYSSNSLIQNFLFSIIYGFGLGNIVYFIFVVKYKKYKLFFSLLIILLISSLFLELSDILTCIANNEKIDFSINNFLLNMEITLVPYSLVSLALIIIKKVYQTYIDIRYSE